MKKRKSELILDGIAYIIEAVFLSIIVGFFMLVIGKIMIFDSNSEEDNSTNLNNEDINSMESQQYAALIDGLNDIKTALKEISDSLVVPKEKFVLKVNAEYEPRVHILNKDASKVIDEPSLPDNTLIAYDIYTGNSIKSDQIINEKVIIPYEEAGYMILFYGKVNANYCWDGDCIINAYKDDVLVYITEAKYNDGELNSYKQAFVDSGFWYTSKRRVIGEKEGTTITSGETWKYDYSSDIKMNFNFEKPKSQDMYTVDKLRMLKFQQLREYYYGNTWNGLYDDQTFGSFLICYNDDLTVRTLYCGRFTAGQFDDFSGTAWEITQQVETGDYYYYEGDFNNGTRPKHNINQLPLTMVDIENKLSEHNIDLNIEWDLEQ